MRVTIRSVTITLDWSSANIALALASMPSTFSDCRPRISKDHNHCLWKNYGSLLRGEGNSDLMPSPINRRQKSFFLTIPKGVDQCPDATSDF
jgi:hypothetical protein